MLEVVIRFRSIDKKSHAFWQCLRVFVLFFFVDYSTAVSQVSLGLSGGYTYNYVKAGSLGKFETNMGQQGYCIEATLLKHVEPWLQIRTGVAYAQKNYLLVSTGPYVGIFHSRRNEYLVIPLTLHFPIQDRKFSPFFDIGIYGGYWVIAKVRGRIANIFDISVINANHQSTSFLQLSRYREQIAFDDRRDSRFEVGWLCRAGGKYSVGKNTFLVCEGAFYGSFKDQQKQQMLRQVSRRNMTWSFSIGVLKTLNQRDND